MLHCFFISFCLFLKGYIKKNKKLKFYFFCLFLIQIFKIENKNKDNISSQT